MTTYEVLTEQGRDYWKGEAERLSVALELARTAADTNIRSLSEQLANARSTASLHVSRLLGAEIQRDEALTRLTHLEESLAEIAMLTNSHTDAVKIAEKALKYFDDAA